MPSLQRVKVRGRSYWRIVESRRVNGKPRAIPILHLGTADALLDRLLNAPQGRLRIRSYQHGHVAALKAAADRLDVVSIIDGHVEHAARNQSVGTTLLLAALNRAIRPRSKRGWAAWAKGTSLHRLFPRLKTEELTSQFFWDQMNCVSLDALEAIEDELTRKVVAKLDLKLDTVFYDTTNFFTYIASTNDEPELPQRGHSKQRRSDLRQFSLALLVSRDGHIPLCAKVYEGNRPDAKEFPNSLTAIRQQMESLSLSLEDVTIVYDKGNNSRDNQALVDRATFGYVGSLTPSHHPELIDIPVSAYRPLPDGHLAGTPVLRLKRNIWGAERTLVLFVSEQLRIGQIRGLEQHLQKRLEKLAAWKESLSRPRSGPRNAKNAEKQIEALLEGQYIKKVLHIEYDEGRQGAERLRYWVDQPARSHLETEVFGKRILMTDRHSWSAQEIMLAYQGQSHVEEAFRQLKDNEHMAVRPQYHWTDHKIHIHTFACLLGLLLGRVVEREARVVGWRGSLSGLLNTLEEVRLAMTLCPSGSHGGRPRCRWQLEETAPETLRLFRNLVPPAAPFVYTHQNP